MTVPHRELFIGGTWVVPAKGKRLDVICPADETVIGSIPAATAEDVNAAVRSARDARSSWCTSSGKYRAQFLHAIAAKVTEQRKHLAALETIDNGKPISEALWDIDDVAACFSYYAGLAEKLDHQQWSSVHLGEDDFKCELLRQPLGAVALISPWNYPMLMAVWKVAPALAAGNAAVLKPSEHASVTCLELAAIAMDVGLPKGVLNVVTGLGPDAGGPLSSHPGIAKVAFTGSVETGRCVNMAAAANLRPTSMELGGKSAMIVFDDVDVDKAVEWCLFSIFWTSGQICTATSRLIVQATIANKFYEQLKQRAEAINIGDIMDESSRMGPLINKGQYDKVLGYIQQAKDEGCQLLTGGGKVASRTKGYWVQPTVFTGVSPQATLWREEVFGPVLACTTFVTEAEAVRLANDHEFGLGGAVISDDVERCRRVAAALECGVTWINCAQPCFCQAPWGGVKNSGFGRELGEAGLEAYMTLKQVTTYTSSKTWDWFSPPSKM